MQGGITYNEMMAMPLTELAQVIEEAHKINKEIEDSYRRGQKF